MGKLAKIFPIQGEVFGFSGFREEDLKRRGGNSGGLRPLSELWAYEILCHLKKIFSRYFIVQ